MVLLWLRKAWGWLKENWKPLLFGIATLGLGVLLGRAFRRPQEVVAPELVGAEDERRSAQDEENRKRAIAAARRVEDLIEIETKHAATIRYLTDEQRAKVEQLKDEPEKLNSYLLQVGKDTRG